MAIHNALLLAGLRVHVVRALVEAKIDRLVQGVDRIGTIEQVSACWAACVADTVVAELVGLADVGASFVWLGESTLRALLVAGGVFDAWDDLGVIDLWVALANWDAGVGSEHALILVVTRWAGISADGLLGVWILDGILEFSTHWASEVARLIILDQADTALGGALAIRADEWGLTGAGRHADDLTHAVAQLARQVLGAGFRAVVDTSTVVVVVVWADGVASFVDGIGHIGLSADASRLALTGFLDLIVQDEVRELLWADASNTLSVQAILASDGDVSWAAFDALENAVGFGVEAGIVTAVLEADWDSFTIYDLINFENVWPSTLFDAHFESNDVFLTLWASSCKSID